MDWRALLKDKRVLIGAAGAAVLGAIVYVRRSGQASGGAATGDGSAGVSSAATGGVQGTADTTGTDVASFLSSYSAALQGQLTQFGGDLNDTLSAIRTGATGGQTTPALPTPNPAGPPGPAPVAVSTPVAVPSPSPAPAPAAAAPQYVTVAKFTTKNPPWSSTLSGIAGHFNTSVSRLLSLNPSIKNANLIRTGQQIRVS